MRYVAAYMLATLGGNEKPSESDLKKILDSVGIEVEKDQLTKVINELKGKNLDEVIAEGEKKLASVPSGGGVAAAAPAAGGGGADPAEAKEEKKEEPEEESDDDMGFGLFD
uniref:Large ribosomal subunit protein P2 n=1 Tax=Cryptochiton stelleri TaxID=6655 RepID=RLA2_CRYST|nr:RecName: Full=Large ribosomal subunit protein P2; AltName: Full=60S acidic ribosomal protein P2 [Cryptochiton stelleri]AAC15656.1 60S ribosomal protein P2 [Cryptochiton stelleri]